MGAYPAYFQFLAVEASLRCFLVGCMSKSAVVLDKTLGFSCYIVETMAETTMPAH